LQRRLPWRAQARSTRTALSRRPPRAPRRRPRSAWAAAATRRRPCTDTAKDAANIDDKGPIEERRDDKDKDKEKNKDKDKEKNKDKDKDNDKKEG
jgi:hypothetical protein